MAKSLKQRVKTWTIMIIILYNEWLFILVVSDNCYCCTKCRWQRCGKLLNSLFH